MSTNIQERTSQIIKAIEKLDTAFIELDPTDLSSDQLEFISNHIEFIFPVYLKEINNKLDEFYNRITIIPEEEDDIIIDLDDVEIIKLESA